MSERCPSCDRRPSSQELLEELYKSRLTGDQIRKVLEELGQCSMRGGQSCRAHTVDWRARALKSENEAAMLQESDDRLTLVISAVVYWYNYPQMDPLGLMDAANILSERVGNYIRANEAK